MRGFASLANMSIRNFQRKFKAEFKRPVREWLNERRAKRILHNIRNTDRSIAEIAASYGFATSSYFTIFCKQYFGMTPSELRRGSKQTSTKGRQAVSSEFSRGGNLAPPFGGQSRMRLKIQNERIPAGIPPEE